MQSFTFLKNLNDWNQNFLLAFFLAGKIIGGPPLNFFQKKSSGETLCKIIPIFPPKVLVYIGPIFFNDTFYFNKLIKEN